MDQDFSDSIAVKHSAGLGGLQKEEFCHQRADSIRGLPQREQLVVSLYYDEELNLKEFGCVLGGK